MTLFIHVLQIFEVVRKFFCHLYYSLVKLVNITDYIVKPASFERLLKAFNKAKEYLDLKMNERSLSEINYFFIKSNGGIEKIFFDDIFFIEAQENYSSIHTKSAKYMVLMSLKNMEASLNNEKFMRVHKSFIVSVNKITGVDGNTILIDNHKIPLSRDAKQMLLVAWTKNGFLGK